LRNCSQILLVLTLVATFFKPANAQECVKVGHNTYLLDFGKTYEVEEFEVFDWVYARCSYLFPFVFPSNSRLEPFVRVTLFAAEAHLMSIGYFDLIDRIVHLERWYPSLSRIHKIHLLPKGSYHSVKFSRKVRLKGLKVTITK